MRWYTHKTFLRGFSQSPSRFSCKAFSIFLILMQHRWNLTTWDIPVAHFYCCRTRPPAHLWLICTTVIWPRRMAVCSLPVQPLLEESLVPYSPLTGWTVASKHLYVCPSAPVSDCFNLSDRMTPFDSLIREDLCSKKALGGPWPSAGIPGNPWANPMSVISRLTSSLPIPPHLPARSAALFPPPSTASHGVWLQGPTSHMQAPRFTEPWMSLQACGVRPHSHQGNKVKQPLLWEGKALLYAVLWASRILNIMHLYCWLVGFTFPYISSFILKIVFKSSIPNWPLCLQKEKWNWIGNKSRSTLK